MDRPNKVFNDWDALQIKVDTLTAENERLTSELTATQNHLNAACDALRPVGWHEFSSKSPAGYIREIIKERDEAREALRPFADLANGIDAVNEDLFKILKRNYPNVSKYMQQAARALGEEGKDANA